MSNDDNQQYFITILNSNGETINITPEILPEQLLPLVQKKHLKEEKVDISNLTSAYKKIFENLAENNSSSLGSISSLSNIINVNSTNNSRIKLSTSNNDHNKNRDNVLSSSSSSIITARSPLQTILLRSSNQNNHNLQSSVGNDHSILPGSSDNSNNYITTLQISQNNSNLSTLAFTQPQTLLHYSNQNPDSPNTVLIPISLHNNNQFSQQQILVAAAVASAGYNQNCNDSGTQNVHSSNSGSNHNLNTTSLAKLISGNVTNPLSINLSNVMKANSTNSDISPSSKSSTNKRKFDMSTTDEFGRRKEMRLLKNREAARECRRKKKEYVKCLENRVTNLEQQNKVLVDEINRMKELYAKKNSKKPSNPPSEVDNKYLEVVYPQETVLKDYYDQPTTSNDCEQQQQQQMKDSTSFSQSIALTSMANITGTNLTQSKYVSKDMSMNMDSVRAAAASHMNYKDGEGLFVSHSQDNSINPSQLSVLLVGSGPGTDGGGGGAINAKYSNQNYPSNTLIYSDRLHEPNSKNIDHDDDDDDDSNSPCDLI